MAPYPPGVTRLKSWGGGAYWRPESLRFADAFSTSADSFSEALDNLCFFSWG